MKNTIIILFFYFWSIATYSQIVVDMAGESMTFHHRNGAYYIKDINNYFGPYLGTWSYTNGNEEFRVTIVKVTMFHEIDTDYNMNYFIDGLLIGYQKYQNGVLVFNSPPDTYPTGISKEFGKLFMSFDDYERNNESFPVDLILIPINQIGNSPQYKLKFRLDMFERRNTYFDQHPTEPYFSVPNNIEMVKVQ